MAACCLRPRVCDRVSAFWRLDACGVSLTMTSSMGPARSNLNYGENGTQRELPFYTGVSLELSTL